MILRFVFCFWFCLLLTSCNNNGQIAQSKQPANVMKVVVEKIDPQEHDRFLKYIGKVVNNNLSTVVAQIAGEILEINYKNGNEVRQGDLILKFDDRDSLNTLTQAMLNLEEKELRYKSELELYNTNLSSDSSVKLLELEVQSAKNALERAGIAWEKTQIVAPYDGMIDEIFVHTGDSMERGKKLFNFMSKENMKISFQVPEKDLHKIVENEEIIDSVSKEKIASVEFISNIADEQTKTYKIEGLLSQHNDYKMGSPIDIDISIGKTVTYKIPSSVIVSNDVGEVGVYTINHDNQAKFFKIDDLVDQDDENLFVTIDGIHGDTLNLIVSGQGFVKDGVDVLVRNNV